MTLAETASSIRPGLSTADVLDDLSLNREGALEKLSDMLRDAGNDKRQLHKLSQKLSRSYKTSPDILAFYLGLDWREGDDAFYFAYREVMLNLATVYPASISMIMQALVSRYLRVDSCETVSELVDEITIDDRTTQVIIKLLKLVPSAGSFLLPSIEFNYPFHSRPIVEHVSYVKNLFHLGQLAPNWRFKILSIVISKALILDVELQNDASALAEIDLEKDTLSCTTEEENDADDEALNIQIPEDTLKRRRLRRIRRGMIKLDCVLDMIFDFIHKNIHKKDGTLDEKKSREMFHFILEMFEKSILPTFKSRYLQFLPFYLASLRPELADQFLGLLFKPLVTMCQGLEHGRSASATPTLLLAVSYIGSFVARARFLTDDLLVLAFDTLVELSTRLVACQSIGSPGILPIMSLQHLMYIFTHRHASLVAKMGEETIANHFDVLLEDISLVEHCNYAVVKDFYQAAHTHYHNLIDEDFISLVDEERSRRECSLRSKYEDLETYFPFDPLPLPRTAKYITSAIFNLAND